MPRPPRTIQGWTLNKVLGEGTDGVAALYTKGNQKVVFKFPTKYGRSSVKQEELVLKRVAKKRGRSRGHLVGAYVGLKPGSFVAQEYIEGTTLYNYATKHRVTAALVKRIVAQLTAGVQALHAIGFAHNDLHLANIMINPTTKEVMIIDYGRTTPAGLLLRDYEELHWKYTIDPNSVAKVTLRDYAWIAAAQAWLLSLVSRPTDRKTADRAHTAAIRRVLDSVSYKRPQRYGRY